MKRRKFLLACTGLAAAAGVFSGCSNDPRTSRLLRLADAFPDQDAVRRVGRRVLESLGPVTTTTLLDELFSADAWQQADRYELAILQDSISADYTTDNTVTADDWVLSRTEAVCYALIAQLTGGPWNYFRGLVAR